jgi:hypothetical protein
VTQAKSIKIEVVVDAARVPAVTGTWTPKDFPNHCTADGDVTGTARGTFSPTGSPIVASAPFGALIARIGGSTADTGPDVATTPSRIFFSAGRQCVFVVPATPAGSLFLGINDDPARMIGVTGSLLVNIYEAV